jgi:glutamine cyclotransferase
MKNNYIKYLFPILFLLVLFWMISCSGKSGSKTVTTAKTPIAEASEAPANLIRMTSPDENSEFKLGNTVNVIIDLENKNRPPDSVIIFFDGRRIISLVSAPWNCGIPSSFAESTGRKSLKAVAYKGGKANTTITRFMVILSDIIPKRNDYKVVHTYPHDRNSFTQGLFYDMGVLYESTGQETSSSLREVELATGKVLRQLNLDPSLFGEGITLYKNRIYQVTWRSKVGFVYEKPTFRQLNKIYYLTEGWGLTTINDRIVMSDGTNVLYFYEPEMFTVVSRLEVYDNEKKVDQLNELEYINGEIWANIWMTDLIARIDPGSGKVLGYIDLKEILSDRDADTNINVLNGIAYDSRDGRIFVTGKNWPKLFEIKVTE